MGFIGKNYAESIEYVKSTNHREFLRITLKNQPSSKVLVIMKNPSKTCDNKCLPIGNHMITKYFEKAKCHIDATTGKVLRKLKSIYDEIMVINLYSLYDPKPKNVNTYYYGTGINSAQLSLSNDNYISSVLNNYSGDIICAWGNNRGINKTNYDAQVNFVTSQFNNTHNLKQYDPSTRSFVPFNPKSHKYPPHGFVWK